MKQDTIPYFVVSDPYNLIYRNGSTQFPVGPHTHNAAELYLTLTPLPDVLLGDTVSQAPAGSLIIIPPFCVHQLFHEKEVVYERYILSVHDSWLEQIFFQARDKFAYLKQDAEPVILPLTKEDVAEIRVLFDETVQEKAGADTTALVSLLHLLGLIDRKVSEYLPAASMHRPSITESQRHVNEMIAYINEHLSDNLGPKELGEHFFLNPDYLSRLFKQHTHTTVSRYIALQKITKAQTLLTEGYSVSQIQEMLGYSGYAHFVKSFKKLTGMTPGQYKASRF